MLVRDELLSRPDVSLAWKSVTPVTPCFLNRATRTKFHPWIHNKLSTLLTRYSPVYLTVFSQNLIIYIKYGRPFIILREQAKKTRSHGVEAIKVRCDLN